MSRPAGTDSVMIACDESGNEGENLMRAGSRVFAHASVSIDVPAAEALMQEVRERTDARGKEVKSSVLLKPRNLQVLRWLLRDSLLVGRANVHLTDKRFFVSSKLIYLVVEDLMY